MPSITINLDEQGQYFLLTGDTDNVLANRRLMFSLKKLGYDKSSENLTIPYAKHTKIQILQELQELLEKFNFVEEKSQETQDSLDSFYQEQATFEEFSNKAKTIRNYQFNELEQDEDFADFCQVVKQEFIRKPRDFQWLSAFHMTFSQKACNFSVPGAGKTTIVYATYAYLKNTQDINKKVDRLVVIGPKSSFAPWENEYKACFGQRIISQRISGEVPIEERRQHLASGCPAELTLISFHSVPNLQNEIDNFIKNNNVMLVVDEAHRIKNPIKTATSILEIGKEAKSRIVLTGTPLPNGYQDLYNLYKFIYPYHYKDILKFHYGNLKDMTQKQELESHRVNQLIDNISSFFIRVKKEDLGLPPIQEKIIDVKMDAHQREIYDFIEEQYVDSFKNNGSATVKDILNKAKLIRLRQASTNPSLLLQPIIENLEENDENVGRFSNNEKIADINIFQEILHYKNIVPNKFIAIKDLLQRKIIPQLEKIIIWTIFIKNAEQLQEYLQSESIKTKLLLGYVNQDKREIIIGSFNNPKDLGFQVVIANPFTVAESISLHKGCHNAIYMERDYNCANFLQSKDRIHRIGLNSNQITRYYYFLSRDSIDEVINQKLNEKAQRMSKVIDGDIPLLSILNDDDETDLIQALIQDYDKRNN